MLCQQKHVFWNSRYIIDLHQIYLKQQHHFDICKITLIFLLLLKSILNKFNVYIILQVKADGLIWVSANPLMSLFLIPLSLTTSSICRKNWLNYIVTASPEIAFLFWGKINYFVSGVHIPAMHLYLPLSQILKIPLHNKPYHKFLPCWVHYIFVLVQMIFAFADQNQ